MLLFGLSLLDQCSLLGCYRPQLHSILFQKLGLSSYIVPTANRSTRKSEKVPRSSRFSRTTARVLSASGLVLWEAQFANCTDMQEVYKPYALHKTVHNTIEDLTYDLSYAPYADHLPVYYRDAEKRHVERLQKEGMMALFGEDPNTCRSA